MSSSPSDAHSVAWELVRWNLGQPSSSGQLALKGTSERLGDTDVAPWVIVAGSRQTPVDTPPSVHLLAGGRVEIHVGFDLLGWIDELLSLSSERGLSRDRLGRAVVSDDLLATHRLPVIDQLLHRLASLIRSTALETGRPFWWLERWPDAAPFALLATHDMDKVNEREPANLVHNVLALAHPGADGLRPASRAVAARRLVRSVARPLRHAARLEQMLAVERQHGVPSTTFVHVDKRLHRYGSRYSLSDPEVADGLRLLTDAGCELALHTGVSYRRDPAAVRLAVENLARATGATIRGARSHYLCLDQPELFDALDAAGLEWDSTVGYTSGVGHRAGTCSPHRIKGRRLVEVPMTAMDFGLLNTADPDTALTDLVTAIESAGGVLTINWHTNLFGFSELVDAVAPYAALLDVSRQHGAWATTVSRLVDWRAAWDDAIVTVSADGELSLSGLSAPAGLVVATADGRRIPRRPAASALS